MWVGVCVGRFWWEGEGERGREARRWELGAGIECCGLGLFEFL